MATFTPHALTRLRRALAADPFFFFLIRSKSHYGAIGRRGPTLVAFEGNHYTTEATGIYEKMLVRYELQKITWSQDQKQQTQLRGTTFSKFSDEVAPIEGTKTVVADLPHCSESTKESTRALCRAGDFGIDTLAGLLAEITECPTWRKNTEVEVLLNVDLIADKAKKKKKNLGAM